MSPDRWPASIVNDGSIGAMGTAGHGVSLDDGGTLTNGGVISGPVAALFAGKTAGEVVIDPGAVFAGAVVGSTSASNTLYLAAGAAAGAFSGLGSEYMNFSTVAVQRSADWVFSGANAVDKTLSIAGSVENTGVIINTNGAGASLVPTGNLDNAGTIMGAAADAGAALAGGYLKNEASALIIGGAFGVYDSSARAAFVNNQGSIAATGAAGYGVDLLGGGTLINAGVISGTHAVRFGGASELVFDPGASFSGGVSVVSGADATLDLGAGAAGTLSALGTTYRGFSTVALAAGAQWSLTGAPAKLTGAGGLTLGAGAVLYGEIQDNSGNTILLNAGTLAAIGPVVAYGGTASPSGVVAQFVFSQHGHHHWQRCRGDRAA